MPKVTVSVPHHFPPEDVIQRAEPYIAKMVDDFEGEDFSIHWKGREADFGFKSLMFRINGTIHVTDQEISVALELPFAAMMFKDKVEKAIHKNLTRALSEGSTE
jgi:hypothetical protein